MRHFGSINEIREASAEKLCEVPEIPEHIGRQIFAFFHEEKEGGTE